MKHKCSICKTKFESNEYKTDEKNYSKLVGKIMAHWQMTHGVSKDIFLYKIFGIDILTWSTI